ncbi:ATP-binding protein [Methanospirillum purgamenti]|uniref:ATP-binding protein n=1 Tax=Methanospirillum hungatei TaxID=2203 RepID=A0A8F5VPI8_METHU|nr:ATP-binding protein [Methanospirillum hungatei]QXO96041.1 ATP-binding protein [Methanospirillum hungatei]
MRKKQPDISDRTLSDNNFGQLIRESNSNHYSSNYKNHQVPKDTERGFDLLDINSPLTDWSSLILAIDTQNSIEQIITERKFADNLAKYGLKPKQKLLFTGQPGTGKTSSAEVLSFKLSLPLVTVNFESVISSYLGETSANLKHIFDFISIGQYVVLFDEFDIIGKKRDDPTEHGEIKRVVNNFMLMLDHFKGNSIIIAATNHAHLLDVGVWRRFDDIIFFDLPSVKNRERIFEKYLKMVHLSDEVNIEKIARSASYYSGSDIEQVCVAAIKECILNNRTTIELSDIKDAISRQNKRKGFLKGSYA